MSWCTHELGQVELDEEGLTPIQRAHRLKAYAQKVVRLAQQGRFDPEKTALARMMGLRSAAQLEGLSDDLDAFTPAQRAQLVRLARSLRAYADKLDGRHVATYHKAPKQRRHRKQGRRLTAVPISGWESDGDGDDEEIGFLPAIPAIIGAAAPLVGSLLGGGKKSSPAPAAAPVVPTSAGPSLPAIGGVVADQIRAVPPPVRQQVTDAVRELMDQQKAGQMDVAAMLKEISSLLGPKLQAQLSSVNQAALQRQATYEHESLKRNDERWKANADAQKLILARLNEMEGKLGTAIETKTRRMKAAGRAFGIPTRYL